MSKHEVPLYAAEYMQGWVQEILNKRMAFGHTHCTEHGACIKRDWRDLMPGDTAVNNIESVALTIVEMCEHFQKTGKDRDARLALIEDIRVEIADLQKYLSNLQAVR
jgi:hypothetical protein